MAQPPRYERKKDFTEDYGDNTDHAAINSELDAASQSINRIRGNLATIQRDDGGLANEIVGFDNLKPEVVDDLIRETGQGIEDSVLAAQQAAAESVNAASISTSASSAASASAANASASAASAQADAQSADSSRIAAFASAASASNSEAAAATSAGNALASEQASASSETAAAASASAALANKESSDISAANALASEQAAAQSESNAQASAVAAQGSQDAAAASEANAALSESLAQALVESLAQPYPLIKHDYEGPCLIKTGPDTISVSAGSMVIVNSVSHPILSDTPVTMPTLSAGSDYCVYALPDGTFQAVHDPYSSPASPPAPGAIKIGGFHYGLVAPGTTVASGGFSTSGVTSAGGSMAWTQADVDRIAGINEFSIWDLAWRCKGEQRGMAYDPISNAWAAIYFMGTSPHINGPSAYNTDIASGTVLPFIPPAWGGDGVLKYAAMNSWTANELVTAFGHRLIRCEEFVSMAFGATEGQSLGGPESTIPATKREPGYTSRIGLEQATGHQFVIGGPIHSVEGSSWSGNGRGSWYGGSGQVRLGGARTHAASSGSRSARFRSALSDSGWRSSVRAASDHLILVGAAR